MNMESTLEKLCEELARWRDSEIRKGNMLKARLLQNVINKRKSIRMKFKNNTRHF